MLSGSRKDYSNELTFKYDTPKRFVTCEISIVINETREMYDDIGIDDPTTRYVEFSFNPNFVVSYRPDPPTEDNPEEGTVFSLPNDEYYVEISVDEFEELIGA